MYKRQFQSNVYFLLITILISTSSFTTSAAAEYKKEIDMKPGQWHLVAMGVDASTLSIRVDSKIIAILSDGVDKNHPEYKSRLVPGWDSTTESSYNGENIETLNQRPIGTIAAGLVGSSDNSSGVSGVAPGAKIMPVRVESDWRSGDRYVASGIDWSIIHGADVIAFVPGKATSEIQGSSIETCAAISRAKLAGVPVFVPAANDLLRSEGGNSSYRPATCEDAVVVGGVDVTLGQVIGAPNMARPSFSVPSKNLISTAPFEQSNGYVSVDGVVFAPALAAAAAAIIGCVAAKLGVDDLIKLMRKNSVDVGPVGDDERTGAGVIDIAAATGFRVLRTNEELFELTMSKAKPRIVRIDQSSTKKVSIIWSPPAGFKTDQYKIIWSSLTGPSKEIKVGGNEVRATLPILLDQNMWFTVTAVGELESRVSAPSRSSMLLNGRLGQSAGQQFRDVVATWESGGIKLTVNPATNGSGAPWGATLRDAITGKELYRTKNFVGASTVLKFAENDPRRSIPMTIWIGNISSGVSTLLTPSYLLSASVLGAGKSYIEISGSTENACRGTFRFGCAGERIKVIDRKTGKTVGSTIVLDNLTFALNVKWSGNVANFEVRGPMGIRSTNLTAKIPGRN